MQNLSVFHLAKLECFNGVYKDESHNFCTEQGLKVYNYVIHLNKVQL